MCSPFVLISLLISLALSENFNPERTRLVDSANGNLLFRGNMPRYANGSFAWSAMLNEMKLRAQNKGVQFPTDFQLIDISFLNVAEEEDLEIEKKFWKENPNLGYLIKWPIVGSLLNPNDIPLDILKEALKIYPHDSPDELVKRTQVVYDLLHTKHPKPVVIYFHCEAGSDVPYKFISYFLANW